MRSIHHQRFDLLQESPNAVQCQHVSVIPYLLHQQEKEGLGLLAVKTQRVQVKGKGEKLHGWGEQMERVSFFHPLSSN